MAKPGEGGKRQGTVIVSSPSLDAGSGSLPGKGRTGLPPARQWLRLRQSRKAPCARSIAQALSPPKRVTRTRSSPSAGTLVWVSTSGPDMPGTGWPLNISCYLPNPSAGTVSTRGLLPRTSASFRWADHWHPLKAGPAQRRHAREGRGREACGAWGQRFAGQAGRSVFSGQGRFPDMGPLALAPRTARA